jgi:hypothetical protein
MFDFGHHGEAGPNRERFLLDPATGQPVED